MQKLLQFRKQIDRVDDGIIKLLNRRLDLVLKVGVYKARIGSKVYDRSREKQVLSRICLRNKGFLKERDIRLIYKKIMQVSRMHQHLNMKKVVDKWVADSRKSMASKASNRLRNPWDS